MDKNTQHDASRGKKSSTGKSKADAKQEIIKNLDQLIDNDVAKKKPSETHTGPAEKLS